MPIRHRVDVHADLRQTVKSLLTRGLVLVVGAELMLNTFLRLYVALTGPMGRIPAEYDIPRNPPIFNIKTLYAYIVEQLWQPEQTMILLAIFGVIAMVLERCFAYADCARPWADRTWSGDWSGRDGCAGAILAVAIVGSDFDRPLHVRGGNRDLIAVAMFACYFILRATTVTFGSGASGGNCTAR